MKTQTLHKLLERQIVRNFGNVVPPALQAFLAEINTAYCEADKDRAMLERALDITSAEMMTLYENLKSDMQKRLEVERDLSDAQAKVFASQKHEALGQLAGNIAHDFNNLLAIIKGYAELLEEDLKDTPKYDQGLQEIILAAERGRGLTGQILAYAKHQQFDLRVMNLNQVINKYATMLGAALGAGILLRLELDAPVDRVLLDETYFSQILLNLTVNARDAMNGKGEFTIRSTRFTGKPDALDDAFANNLVMRHRAETDGRGEFFGEFVCVEFSDTGTGIPAEAIPRIFEPYYTTKEMGKGTGLGLAVVYGIVKQLQGYIFCTSRENEGTTFRLLLPVAVARAETEENQLRGKAAAGSIDPSRTRVLVVDDEKSLREVVTQHLLNDRFIVAQAKDGDAAVSYIRAHPGEIDFVLTDIVMPGMTGLEMAAEIRHLQPKIHILFMSGYSEVTLNHNWAQEKRPLLQKPFSRAELMSGVYSLITPA